MEPVVILYAKERKIKLKENKCEKHDLNLSIVGT